jgi:putative ABC transport system substrate-binding protein
MHFGQLQRREFIAALGGAAAWPLAARAQRAAMPVVGFLHLGSPEARTNLIAAFRLGLSEAGFIDGRDVQIEYRWARDQIDRLPELAADLVRRQVAVIVATGGGPPVLAAKAATATIPIVIITGGDPVQMGLVASLNRPGGNVTGVAFLTTELVPKRLDLLRELVPQATVVGYLGDPRTPVGKEMADDMIAAAATLGRQVAVAEARSIDDFEPAFASFVDRGVGALVVGTDPLFTSNRGKLVALAARYKLPTIYQAREYAVEGGLMSYGANLVDAYRLGGRYAGQILRGVKPADLPVEQSSRFELVINMKTAKALGLTVPDKLLALADEVIE